MNVTILKEDSIIYQGPRGQPYEDLSEVIETIQEIVTEHWETGVHFKITVRINDCLYGTSILTGYEAIAYSLETRLESLRQGLLEYAVGFFFPDVKERNGRYVVHYKDGLELHSECTLT